MNIKIVSVCVSWLLLAACSETAPSNRAVYLLMDTSGTYPKELEKAQIIMNYL